MADAEVENLTTFIQSHVPSATCHSNVGSELSYLLSANDVQHFVKLFQVRRSEKNYRKLPISKEDKPLPLIFWLLIFWRLLKASM